MVLYVVFCCNYYKHNVLYFISLLGQMYQGMAESTLPGVKSREVSSNLIRTGEQFLVQKELW